MNELLAHPAVQGGAAPFLAGLVAALAWRTRPIGGLALTVAFAVAVAMTIGWSFESMSSTRKLCIAGVASGLLGLVIELARIGQISRLRLAVAGLAALAALWVLLGLLRQQDQMQAIAVGVAASLFIAALVDSCHAAPRTGVAADAVNLVLGLAAGALALLGASAVLALLGIAVGAGAGALVLVRALGRSPGTPEWTTTFPASLVAGLVTVLAVQTGGVPWYAALPLLAVPLCVRCVAADRPTWLQGALAVLAALGPAVISVALAWAGNSTPLV